MKSLFIENSTELGTVALSEDLKILVHRTFLRAGGLAAAIQEIFSEFGVPDELVVGTGPGSYSGLRVASATAIGLQVALGCPAYGCPSVLGYETESYHVVGNARLGAFFLASIDMRRVIRGPELVPLGEFQVLRPRLETAPIFATGPIPGVTDLQILRPEAQFLIQCRTSFGPGFEPLYLRKPAISAVRGNSCTKARNGTQA